MTDTTELLSDEAHAAAYRAFVSAVEAGECDGDASRRAKDAGTAEGDGSPA